MREGRRPRQWGEERKSHLGKGAAEVGEAGEGGRLAGGAGREVPLCLAGSACDLRRSGRQMTTRRGPRRAREMRMSNGRRRDVCFIMRMRHTWRRRLRPVLFGWGRRVGHEEEEGQEWY